MYALNILDNIANFFILFSHATIIVPIIILGFIFLKHMKFYDVTYLLLLSIILSAALKVTFKIPLFPELSEDGFAFPSGHMQASVTFYGWFINKSSKTLVRILIILLLFSIGFSLVHLGYHNYYDIWGGVFFAVLLITMYQIISTKYNLNLPWIILSISSLLIVYIGFKYKLSTYLWFIYCGIVSLTLTRNYTRLSDDK